MNFIKILNFSMILCNLSNYSNASININSDKDNNLIIKCNGQETTINSNSTQTNTINNILDNKMHVDSIEFHKNNSEIIFNNIQTINKVSLYIGEKKNENYVSEVWLDFIENNKIKVQTNIKLEANEDLEKKEEIFEDINELPQKLNYLTNGLFKFNQVSVSNANNNDITISGINYNIDAEIPDLIFRCKNDENYTITLDFENNTVETHKIVGSNINFNVTASVPFKITNFVSHDQDIKDISYAPTTINFTENAKLRIDSHQSFFIFGFDSTQN